MSSARVETLAQDVLPVPRWEHVAVDVVVDNLLELLDYLVPLHLLRRPVVHRDVGAVQLQ